MIRVRRSAERGHFRNDWLDARFSFSFGGYQDPAFDGYSDLMVLNDDRVAPGAGFTMHGHRDVEVMSYPVSGAVAHRDSLGHAAVLRPGDVHLMRAGSGIRHSEMNASDTAPEHHLQWWIRPAVTGLAPEYERLHLDPAELQQRWRLLASPDAGRGVLALAQDTRVLATRVAGGPLTYRLAPGRRAYLHVVAGRATVGPLTLVTGDAVFIEHEPAVQVAAPVGAPAELLLFDLR